MTTHIIIETIIRAIEYHLQSFTITVVFFALLAFIITTYDTINKRRVGKGRIEYLKNSLSLLGYWAVLPFVLSATGIFGIFDFLVPPFLVLFMPVLWVLSAALLHLLPAFRDTRQAIVVTLNAITSISHLFFLIVILILEMMSHVFYVPILVAYLFILYTVCVLISNRDFLMGTKLFILVPAGWMHAWMAIDYIINGKIVAS